MSDEIERLEDGTVRFLPERLNRDPVVLRGLTSDEMWLALGIGAAGGLLLGIPLAVLFSALAIVPTLAIAGAALSLFSAGTLLRRAKRGRPDTWLYRRAQLWLARRTRFNRAELIVQSGPWSVRRARRFSPRRRT
jgi:conjugative transfer region protein (TIGR03750 family)